jgi:hypothetical protein
MIALTKEEQSQCYYNQLKARMKEVGSCEMTLAQHAEMWWFEKGNKIIPKRYSVDWTMMYSEWIQYAFKYNE